MFFFSGGGGGGTGSSGDTETISRSFFFSGSTFLLLDYVSTVDAETAVLCGCPASGVPLEEEPASDEEPAEAAAGPGCLEGFIVAGPYVDKKRFYCRR